MSRVIWLLPFAFGSLSWPIRSQYCEVFPWFFSVTSPFCSCFIPFTPGYILFITFNISPPSPHLSIAREHLHVMKTVIPCPEVHRDLGSCSGGEKTEQDSAFKILIPVPAHWATLLAVQPRYRAANGSRHCRDTWS